MLNGQRDAMMALDQITEGDGAEVKKDEKKKLDGKKLLGILAAQKARSIGFDNDKELNDERTDALDYYKGKHEGAIKRDLPALPNRSSVVDTSVANGVEMALPDIIGIFTEGDDGLTFKPVGLEDVEQAKQETDYVRHIVFQQNDGWMLLYNAIKDALISKTGIFHFQWDGDVDYEDYTAEVTEPQIEEIEAAGNELIDFEETNVFTKEGFQVFSVTFRKPSSDGHVAICVVPPEDFTVSPDTVKLKDTEYCAMRSKVSRQSLLERGYDREKVLQLDTSDNTIPEKMSRDTVEEGDETDEAGAELLEMVDIVTHYIRIDLDNSGRRQIWRVVTGNDEEVELEREKRSMIEFAALTPFPMPHRFYGQSLADKLIQTQKWKTTVTRQVNDHLYFANNQRQEVKKAGIIVGVTVEQLNDNAPGQPVVTEDGNSLRPIQNGTLGVDALGLLEYISADSEQRSGIMRYGNGMNPDSLHETKGGSDNQLNAAQKRHRMMARLFAEGGLKDLYLGVHDLARQNATMKDTAELRGKWVEISPSSWRRRKDMVISIGIGSGGTEDDLNRLREWRGIISQVVQAQGGLDVKDGIVTKQNVYEGVASLGEKLRIKDAALQITNPAEAAKMKAMSGEQEQPEMPPEVLKAQMEMKVEQETQAARIKLETVKAETQAKIDLAKMQEANKLKREQMLFDQQLEAERAALQLKLEQDRAAAELQMQREKAAQELQLARDKAAAELQLARENAELEAELAERNSRRETALMNKEIELTAENDANEIKNNRPGGSLAE